MSKIYLISPPKINLEEFSNKLEEAFLTQKIAVFQLRLKNISDNEIIKCAKKLIKICQKYDIPFILNDRLDLAIKAGANGVHLGSDDGDIKKARQIAPQNFIIGASCYDSRDLIMNAANDGANYVALGAFFESTTKKSQGKPEIELLNWCNAFINVQNVCIGGINDKNYSKLVNNNADFIAIISYVWNHDKGVTHAINSLKLIK